jgi:hypothetical protein
MTIGELRTHLKGLPDEMTVVIAGEKQFYDVGGLDWAACPSDYVYVLCGDIHEGPHRGSSWTSRMPGQMSPTKAL